MSHRSPSFCRFWFVAAAFVAATGGGASVGRSQQVVGSIGASLMILEPVAAPPLRITGLDIGPDGVAHVETMLPSSRRTSQIVMARVSSSTTGFAPQPPLLVAPSGRATRVRHQLSIGRDRRSDAVRPTEVRVEYLIIAAGT